MSNLSPGPISVLTPSVGALTTNPHEFSALVSDSFAGLPPVENELDAYLVGLGNTPTPSLLDELNAHVEAMSSGLADVAAVDPEDGLDTIESQNDFILSSLDQPHRDLPAEIYRVIPDPQFISGTSGPFPGIPGPMTLQISNQTRGGSSDFYPGDQFRIFVTISSGGGNFDFQNIDVWIIRFLNGVEVPVLDIGSTDNNGNVSYLGTIAAGDVGSWRAYTLPLGSGADDTITYTVHPSTVQTPPPPPPPTSGPGVSLSINGSPYTGAAAHVGDSFTLHFTGNPGALVEINGLFNGAELGWTPLGSIDSGGHFDDNGSFNSIGFIGHWIESYRIGGVQLATTITFDVQA